MKLTIKTLYLAITLSIATVASCKAQSVPTRMVNAFFEAYSNNPSKALDELELNTNVRTESISVLKSTLMNLGTFQSYDRVNKYGFGRIKHYRIYDYVVMHDNQIVRFQFTFFKPDVNWVMYDFRYDGNVHEEFIKSAELKFLKARSHK